MNSFSSFNIRYTWNQKITNSGQGVPGKDAFLQTIAFHEGKILAWWKHLRRKVHIHQLGKLTQNNGLDFLQAVSIHTNGDQFRTGLNGQFTSTGILFRFKAMTTDFNRAKMRKIDEFEMRSAFQAMIANGKTAKICKGFPFRYWDRAICTAFLLEYDMVCTCWNIELLCLRSDDGRLALGLVITDNIQQRGCISIITVDMGQRVGLDSDCSKWRNVLHDDGVECWTTSHSFLTNFKGLKSGKI